MKTRLAILAICALAFLCDTYGQSTPINNPRLTGTTNVNGGFIFNPSGSNAFQVKNNGGAGNAIYVSPSGDVTIGNAGGQEMIKAYTGELVSGGQATVDWANRWLVNLGGVNTINWQDNTLASSTGVTVGNWEAMKLIDGGGSDSVLWNGRNLQDSDGVTAIDWGQRLIIDSVAATSIDWETRALYNPSGTAVVSWAGNGLTPDTTMYPKVVAYPSTNQVLTSVGSVITLDLGAEIIDTANAFSANTFTVPANAAGYYQINAPCILLAGGGSCAGMIVSVYVNGSAVTRLYQSPLSGGFDHGTGGSALIQLNASDAVTIRMQQTDGAAWTVWGGISTLGQVSIYRVF